MTFENTGTEPLVILRYFGPDSAPNAPDTGAFKTVRRWARRTLQAFAPGGGIETPRSQHGECIPETT